MKDIVLAAGPWVGGPMTNPHRKVLVARVSAHGWGYRHIATIDRSSGLPVGVVPEEFAVYTDTPEGLTGGDYFPCGYDAHWRNTLMRAFAAWQKAVVNHVESYTPHVLITEEPQSW